MGGLQNGSASLAFVQIVEDQRFGSVRVYRQQEKPYGYYMKLAIEQHTGQPNSIDQIQRIVGMLKQEFRHEFLPSMLLPIEVKESCGIRQFGLVLSYQNYTLREFCQGLYERLDWLAEDQICFIVDTAIQIHREATSNGLELEISMKELLVTPEGSLMLYPFALQQDSRSSFGRGCENVCVQSTKILKPQERSRCFPECLRDIILEISKGSPSEQRMQELTDKIIYCKSLSTIEQLYPWRKNSSGCLILPANRGNFYAKCVAQRSRHSIASGSTLG